MSTLVPRGCAVPRLCCVQLCLSHEAWSAHELTLPLHYSCFRSICWFSYFPKGLFKAYLWKRAASLASTIAIKFFCVLEHQHETGSVTPTTLPVGSTSLPGDGHAFLILSQGDVASARILLLSCMSLVLLSSFCSA